MVVAQAPGPRKRQRRRVRLRACGARRDRLRAGSPSRNARFGVSSREQSCCGISTRTSGPGSPRRQQSQADCLARALVAGFSRDPYEVAPGGHRARVDLHALLCRDGLADDVACQIQELDPHGLFRPGEDNRAPSPRSAPTSMPKYFSRSNIRYGSGSPHHFGRISSSSWSGPGTARGSAMNRVPMV